jgi:hypothetical protein
MNKRYTFCRLSVVGTCNKYALHDTYDSVQVNIFYI